MTRAQLAALLWWTLLEFRDALVPPGVEDRGRRRGSPGQGVLVRAIGLGFFAVSPETYRVGAEAAVSRIEMAAAPRRVAPPGGGAGGAFKGCLAPEPPSHALLAECGIPQRNAVPKRNRSRGPAGSREGRTPRARGRNEMIVPDLFSKVALFDGLSPADRACDLQGFDAADLPARRADRHPGPARRLLLRSHEGACRRFDPLAGGARGRPVDPLGGRPFRRDGPPGRRSPLRDRHGGRAFGAGGPDPRRVLRSAQGKLRPQPGAPFDLLPPAPARERHDRGAGLARREGPARPLLSRPRRRTGPESGRRLDRRRPPVAARDRRHHRVQPGDRLPHDVPAVAGEPHRAEGQGHSTSASRELRPPGAEPRWSCVPGPCRTS